MVSKLYNYNNNRAFLNERFGYFDGFKRLQNGFG